MSKKSNKFPRTVAPTETVDVVEEVGTVDTQAGGELLGEQGQDDQNGTVETSAGEAVAEAGLDEALKVEGNEAPQKVKVEDEVLFETIHLEGNEELPMHLQVIKEYLEAMRPTVPQKDLVAWQSRLHSAITTLFSIEEQFAVPQLRVFISWLREEPNNAMQPAYRARSLESLKLRGHQLREYEALLHAIYTISVCETKGEFAKYIDWESLRSQFTGKNSDVYTRILLGVCGY